MNWWLPHKFETKKTYLEVRVQLIRAMRAHFDDQDFWEVQTPILQTMPGADVHIHAYKLENGAYLHNSPEFAMKKLLVAGAPKIYQICPVFRREERTNLHNPEFTMLEWYRAQADYTNIMKDCEELLRSLEIKEFHYNGQTCDPHAPWRRITVCEAFKQYTDIDLASHFGNVDTFRSTVAEKGIRTIETDNWDDIFHAVMAEKIEPHLGQGAPTILYDYPASMAVLSRKKPEDPRLAERFELYVCGVELANAFSELTDPAEQRARFIADMAEKQRLYGESYPLD
ncbi:MAG TPA: EF-P lysine aminoacylase EpmA, partial [Alphaproteobacteria bacterium]|nr:EF-P lysine aminoacylase EpmA [Alphaproteobacteria bacterium]